MAVSIAASNSQTATQDTNHTLVTQVAPVGGAHYQLRVDTSALGLGQRVILTLQTKARVGDTTRTIYSTSIDHTQSDPIKDSPVVGIEESNVVVAILRLEGATGLSFPWALRRVDG